MLIDDRKVDFQIECGASINIILAKHAEGHDIQATTKTLRMWNGSQVKPVGTTIIVMRNPKTRKKYSVEFVVVDSDLTPLIGERAAQEMKLSAKTMKKFSRRHLLQDQMNSKSSSYPQKYWHNSTQMFLIAH